MVHHKDRLRWTLELGNLFLPCLALSPIDFFVKLLAVLPRAELCVIVGTESNRALAVNLVTWERADANIL